MKIYSRTGDDGTTGLFSGERVAKTHGRVEAYGTVDELNSVLGLARALGPQPAVDALLSALQGQLFKLGADLATPASGGDKVGRMTTTDVHGLEIEIDRMTAELPVLRRFILPGGTPAAAQIHVARTLSRRAERDALRVPADDPVTPAALIYLNRLSDFLFTLARHENSLAGRAETEWSPEP